MGGGDTETWRSLILMEGLCLSLCLPLSLHFSVTLSFPVLTVSNSGYQPPIIVFTSLMKHCNALHPMGLSEAFDISFIKMLQCLNTV